MSHHHWHGGSLDLGGLRVLSRHGSVASRAHLAVDIHAALVIPQKSLRIVAVQGEQGIGKSQLIAEWWHNHGRKHFNKNVIALDCSRRGGDKIVEALNRHFLNLASEQLTEALSAQINTRERVAIILDGLSHDESAPTLTSSDAMIATGQVDKATLRANDDETSTPREFRP